jgi:hypothetical protein
MLAWEAYDAAKDKPTWVNEHPDQFRYIAIAEKEKARQEKERRLNAKSN